MGDKAAEFSGDKLNYHFLPKTDIDHFLKAFLSPATVDGKIHRMSANTPSRVIINLQGKKMFLASNCPHFFRYRIIQFVLQSSLENFGSADRELMKMYSNTFSSCCFIGL